MPGDYSLALQDYTSVIGIDPEHVDALVHRGTVNEKLGYLDAAIADFSRVLELEPNHVKAAYARGACRNLKGDFADAIGSDPSLTSRASHHGPCQFQQPRPADAFCPLVHSASCQLLPCIIRCAFVLAWHRAESGNIECLVHTVDATMFIISSLCSAFGAASEISHFLPNFTWQFYLGHI